MQKLLIVEDEEAIARVLGSYLKKAGFDVISCMDGITALQTFQGDTFDLVLLDIMLPGIDGFELLGRIREISACPVIMLTARDLMDDRLEGLNSGADDYMIKPFVPDEVVARVKAVLRRRPVYDDDRTGRQHFGHLLIDSRAKRVFLRGQELALSPRDLDVLLFLSSRPNRVFTREQLIEEVWGFDYEGSDRAVDLSIKRLRKLLAGWPPEQGEIRTLRGSGYSFCIES
ncbi:two-component system response regulator [Paenibacillus yonginensis]|uniref:Two-component system response regulator n=1 Tax=Paenibacillus yonginensis TaxID=1462996 RepID=A0A1B1N0X9_9BACL|nr:response regulator transcription factor [Paenibacillus yonginensis]ANS75071.1 two-component system response regulator [Paenibacillus yonginensis]